MSFAPDTARSPGTPAAGPPAGQGKGQEHKGQNPKGGKSKGWGKQKGWRKKGMNGKDWCFNQREKTRAQKTTAQSKAPGNPPSGGVD